MEDEANLEPWTHQTWDQVPRMSEYLLPTGYTRCKADEVSRTLNSIDLLNHCSGKQKSGTIQ